MRTPFIAGNWKMNTNIDEAVALARAMLAYLESVKGVEKAVCPPFVSLQAVSSVIKGTTVKLGAQNMYFQERGAYTGEVSPLMLVGLCEWVILGHSERRQYFGESDEIVNKKVMAALKHGLRPIVCVGENLAENEAGKTESVVTLQVKGALAGVPPTPQLVIAYEPIWAIGTGKAATAEQAGRTIGLIRRTAAEVWNTDTAGKIRILYGGSVTAANIKEFVGHAEVDGALVGGASLKAADFAAIVSQTASAKAVPK